MQHAVDGAGTVPLALMVSQRGGLPSDPESMAGLPPARTSMGKSELVEKHPHKRHIGSTQQ
jgi:hypothetical protein